MESQRGPVMATAQVMEANANANMPHTKSTGPCVMIIFGAAGDLTKRKLLPSIYNLLQQNLLSREFAIVGVSRDDFNTEKFRKHVSDSLQQFGAGADPELIEWLANHSYYVQGEFDNPDLYNRLGEQLAQVDKQHNTHGNYFFYLAIAPQLFAMAVEQLGRSGLSSQERNGSWRRVIIEKPFGRDLESARALNHAVKKVLDEEQIYRIDHYLGKETVQNILVFRFGNGLFEPIWNRRYLDNVQITVAEEIGVGGRGAFYEEVGAIRDMVQTHLFQALTFLAMEPPVSFEP